MSQCKKFAPNIFHKTKCSNCFRQKEEHSAEALECNRECRSIARSGYLFVAPDWDFSVPLNRTKRWQRRWFVLYDDGELNYSVDEHPDTIPQGSVDMSKVLEVTGAEQVTGHPHSLALTSPDRVTFVKAASREDARWWAELLAVFPRRHKRNATFPGGRASPSLPQLGRSASPQPPRPRHLSCTGPSPRTNFETPPLKEERESPPKEDVCSNIIANNNNKNRSGWLMPETSGNVPTETVPIISPIRTNDYLMSSGSPPTRDKLRCEDKARARRDWRNERLRDIATALTDRSPESSLALPAESLLHLKKGWLWSKNSLTGDLERRWVVLSGPSLNVYPDQDQEQSTPEVVVELTSVTGYDEVPTESKYGFEVRWAGPTLVLSAVTAGIRSNWLQALKKAAPIVAESPTTPPRSILSSDEEYRTASEGGRRGSEDWGDLPPSPPLTRNSLLRCNAKDRVRLRPRLPRCQSRQSTLDSTSTDEIDSVKLSDSTSVELNNTINRQNVEIGDLQKQLAKSEAELHVMEEEIARLKKFQADAAIQESKAKEMMSTFERTERELNQRNCQAEAKFVREQRSLQRRLADAEERARLCDDKCASLGRELQTKQRIVSKLESDLSSTTDSLSSSRSAFDRLNNHLYELQRNKYRNVRTEVDSLTDLINIDLDVNIDELGQNELQEYCLDLRGRFERAVLEIRAVKRELRETQAKVDDLEIGTHSLREALDFAQDEKRREVGFLVVRLEHLTSKLSQAEKQVRNRSRSESRDKRRSLSLKGRESFSINKEVEDKVTELEAKIVALERGRARRKHKRDRSSERSSPIDDKSLRRLRRKSLDSATSSEPMKLLMRLSSLETKVTSVNVSTESLNSEDSKSKLKECLHHLNLLRNCIKRPSSPSMIDKHLMALETNLNEAVANENDSKPNNGEVDVINASANSVVKQLENLLVEKLTNISEKRRDLRERNQLDSRTRLELLAEKVAYENILISRIQESLMSPPSGEVGCDRLIRKEAAETANWLVILGDKLAGKSAKLENRTGADYLSKILAKCLTSATRGFVKCRNYVRADSVTFGALEDQRKKIESAFIAYKRSKLPQLAEALAYESADLNDIADDFSRSIRDSVDSELIQSEVSHVMSKAAQMYRSQSDADQRYFFSFFAAERATMELWSDSVNDRLHQEIDDCVEEICEAYKGCLNKIQRQNWRRRVESERNRSSGPLLQEYADIIAHKAMVDARLDVFGDFNKNVRISCEEGDGSTTLVDWLENEKCWDRVDRSVQINQSLQVEFGCMVERFGRDFMVDKSELDDVLGYLNDLAEEIGELQKITNTPSFSNDVKSLDSWSDVCSMCRSLRNKLEQVRRSLGSNSPRSLGRSHSFKRFESLEELRPVFLGTEYLTQVEALRSAYRRAIVACNDKDQEIDIQQLQILCEKVLGVMEQWHKRTVQEMRESHAEELEVLRLEKEQALAEETQATLAALDAMRKAHEAEVQREVAKFKHDWARQQRDDILDLSERLSVKCLEAAALEEQLGSMTRQLTHAQQHILQLERNPQLSSLQN